MKKIYNLLTSSVACIMVMTLAVTVATAQCPPGQTNVEVTYTAGGFNFENGWALWDATTGTELLCAPTGGLGPAAGTQSVCVTDNNAIELRGFETFGDGWCPPANIVVAVNETGAANGCANPNGGPAGVAQVIYDGDSGASGTGAYACTGNPSAGAIAVSFSTFCPSCEATCPDDIEVSTDDGVCEATVTIPNPTLPAGCELLGAPGNFSTATGPQVPLNFNAVGLINTPFSVSGLSPVPATATCVTEVCIDWIYDGDFGGAGFENANIQDENGNIIDQTNDGMGGDCAGYEGSVCVPVATYNDWAADGVANFTLLTDADVDNICVNQFIQASITWPMDCVDFLNSFTGLANGPATYPLGTTCVEITGTGSGNGMAFPINCKVNVTVVDDEPPMLTCPGDFTFNLQGGECEQIYDYEVLVSDNCPVGGGELPGTVFGSLGNCPGSGFTIACNAGLTSQVQEIDISGFPNNADVQIDEGCFVFDNAAWGINMGIINFYIAPAGATAAQTPPPCYKTATPAATSGLVDLSGFTNGNEACIPVFDMNGDPFIISPGTPGLYIEARALQTGAFTFNGEMCNGIIADGTNTFLCSDLCGDGYLTQFGFNTDAFFSFTGSVLPPPPPMEPGLNEFASGDALPIGVHCFSFTATDNAGNLSSCDWCVTVNEFPEDQIVSSLACNDLVNVSLNEDCEAFISADMFLEGGPYACYETGYEVYVEGVSGDVNFTSLELAPGTYTVTVTDPERDNSCWGEMLIEDKLPPMMPPIEDITITCKEDIPDLLSAGRAFPAIVPVENIVGEEITATEPAQTLEFEVVGDCEITDLDVAVDLEHTWIGDIELSITSPSGTTVALWDNQCITADDINTVFDDEGANFACGSAQAGINMQTPTPDMLSAFDGEIMGGTWTVRWDDTAGGDDGEFLDMTLVFNDGEVFCGATVSPDDYLTATANSCEIVDLEVLQTEVVGNSCDGTTTLRTWVATDASGNTSSKVQQIVQERVSVSDVNEEWFWPVRVVELTCGAETTPDAIYDYYRGIYEANNPCPLPTCDETDEHNYDPDFVETWECGANAAGVRFAYPLCFNDKGLQESFLDNACNIFFSYTDLVLPACGPDCSGNSKVIRTWTALDWCDATTTEFEQVIHAKDNEGPSAKPFDPITVSANPWGCAASFTLPVPEKLKDNCSDVVTYRIYGQPGTITEVLAGPRILLDDDDNPVLDADGNPVWVVEGLPKAMAPYVYTYELIDCCGNVSYLPLSVTVVDGTPPVAVAKQNIVISLTSSPTDPEGGSAKLYVHSVDNGSHDGDCGPVRMAIRRTDEGVCGNLGLDGHENNFTFFNFNDLPNSQQPQDHDRDDTDEGQFVKFCCLDLFDPNGNGVDEDGDGVNDYVLIDVELGVWDDANMDGVPGTPGDLFGITWATVRVEAKLQPTLTCPPLVKITCDMDEKDLSVTGGSAHASSTCGDLPVEYFDLCGLDINQDGEITEFTVTDRDGMMINEVAMCTDVNRDGVIQDYIAPWWSTVDEDLFNKACHYGPITRWWSIAGTEVQCRQLIIVEEPTEDQRFDGSVSIDWPYSEDEFIRLADNDGDDCGLMEVSGSDIEQFDTNDDDIPDFAEVALSCIDGLCDEPVWVDATCSLIGWTLESDTFYFEEDACRKIINEYTVIDWCQYNPNDPSQGGIWTWTVIGKLLDTYAPVVEAENDMFEAVPGTGGSGTSIDERACVGVGIQMSATAFDTNVDEDGEVIENACPSEWLKWNVYVDIFNDWVFDREWSSFVAEDRNTSTDPLWSEDNAADNLEVYGYLIPDVRVGNRGGVDNNEGEVATAPGFEYTINIPDQIPADCGETMHRVVWKVYDGCGNVASTTSYFTVQDKKAPTPYCINLSTALMADPDGDGPAECMVELWAIDFDYGSFDNCTAYEDLRYTFTETQPELDPDYIPELRSSAKVWTADDLQGVTDATLSQNIYVWDECGNYDWCVVNIRIVDNNACLSDTTTGSIAGIIETEFSESIENVEVHNENMFFEFESTDMSDNDGSYAFANNALGMDYQVKAVKNDDYLNGVSTLDLVLIQRHILGLESLDSAYKMIAADVNNDGNVTAIDLIELRKLILGIYDELPSNSSWRFVDAAQTLDINSPWNFDETIDIYNLSTDMMDENFVGIKVGDVNQSVVANSVSGSSEEVSSAVVSIDFEDIAVEAGQTFDLAVNADVNNIYGYQFTLETNGLELVTVQSGAVKVSEENFGVHNGAVTTSWNSKDPVNATGALFTMTFKANTAGTVSDLIDINSDITKAEAYVGSDLEIVNIDLNKAGTADAEFALYQNEPNPFTANTVIGFEIPRESDVILTVLDVTGKVVHTERGNFAQGYNEIELSKSDLGAAGVYYYQIDSGDFTATKKMIIIE